MVLQNSFIVLSIIALQRIVHEFGTDFVSSYSHVKKIELLVQHPFMSFEVAMATYNGGNIGAGKVSRVKFGYVQANICISCFSLFFFILSISKEIKFFPMCSIIKFFQLLNGSIRGVSIS